MLSYRLSFNDDFSTKIFITVATMYWKFLMKYPIFAYTSYFISCNIHNINSTRIIIVVSILKGDRTQSKFSIFSRIISLINCSWHWTHESPKSFENFRRKKNTFMKAFHQKGTNIEGDAASKGVFQRLSSNSLCLKSHWITSEENVIQKKESVKWDLSMSYVIFISSE